MSTVLITGGGSGIGAGLAAAFHAKGAQVIVAGRRRARLEEVAAQCPGMAVEVVDVGKEEEIVSFAERVLSRWPDLDTLINNAGIQRTLDFRAPLAPAAVVEEVDVNLKGLMLVTNAFLPHLLARPNARLINVGSGLAYVPLAAAPVYSATKAAVHSFSLSLRRQLAGTSVSVVELIPPAVDTELHRGQSRKPPRTMPLEDFVKAAMKGLDAGRSEVRVGLADVLALGSRVAPSFFLRMLDKPRS